MRGFHNGSFDPQSLVLIETAFDEAWLTLKSVGNKTVKPDELARSVLDASGTDRRIRLPIVPGIAPITHHVIRTAVPSSWGVWV